MPSREEYLKRSRDFSARMEKTGLAEPFKGITTDGTVVPGLFRVRSTGVSTAPVRTAAEAFLSRSPPNNARRTMFPVDHDEWRKWANQHVYFREGIPSTR